MPTITGNIADTGFGRVAEARVVFRLVAPAFDVDGGLHVTEDVEATPDVSGNFIATLPEFGRYPGPAPVAVGVAWWEHESDLRSGRAPRMDWLRVAIFIPREGGALADLIGKQVGNDLVYSAPDAVDLSEQTGFQLNTVTGDLYQWQE